MLGKGILKMKETCQFNGGFQEVGNFRFMGESHNTIYRSPWNTEQRFLFQLGSRVTEFIEETVPKRTLKGSITQVLSGEKV